ncbi:hypothetical protein D1631_05450 [Chryseobacterium nematophagum]|uniref:Protein glutaminase domain-containing protein n=1 Tax=Chryseobacterium nematophagum TaxID=2305228 RepID=A0A3M7TEL4_9FLAO|nr:protein-glutamine glutaminase family protein [Chryseobacterium nematophagum]RNA61416.1 hypothetical protein D1631_05450 [Chryseobacterium nematophagum]
MLLLTACFNDRDRMDNYDYSSVENMFNEINTFSCLNYNSNTSACIDFNYNNDGSFARAHKMREILIYKGINEFSIQKIWIYGTGNESLKNGWKYHVAIIVGGQVIDPSLFNTPVSIERWANACRSYSNQMITTQQTPGYFYAPSKNFRNTGSYDTDPAYDKTNCILNTINYNIIICGGYSQRILE